MTDVYVEPLRQENGLAERSHVYGVLQDRRAVVDLQHDNGLETSTREGRRISSTQMQQPEANVEHSRNLQELRGGTSRHHQQRFLDMTILERQLQLYHSLDAIQRQRLVDVELKRSRMLESFQLDRVLRSKEAAANVEALSCRMRQHDAETAWRAQRNSCMREEVFSILHWKLTHKDVSDARTRLERQKKKFAKEVTRFFEAESARRAGLSPSSSPISAATNRPQATYADSRSTSKIRPTASKASTCALGGGCSSERTAKNGKPPSGRYSTHGSGSGAGSAGKSLSASADTQDPATAKAGATQAEYEYSHLTRGTVRAGSAWNADSGADVDKKFPSRAAGQQTTTHEVVHGAAFASSSLSLRTPCCNRSSRPTESGCVDRFSNTVPCSEPFRVRLLALHYEQEMAALELPHAVHRPDAPPRGLQNSCDNAEPSGMMMGCITSAGRRGTAAGSSPGAYPRRNNAVTERGGTLPAKEAVNQNSQAPLTTKAPSSFAATSRRPTRAEAGAPSARAVSRPNKSQSSANVEAEQTLLPSSTLEADTGAEAKPSPPRHKDADSSLVIRTAATPTSLFAPSLPAYSPASDASKAISVVRSTDNTRTGRDSVPRRDASAAERARSVTPSDTRNDDTSAAQRARSVTPSDGRNDGVVTGTPRTAEEVSAAHTELERYFGSKTAQTEGVASQSSSPSAFDSASRSACVTNAGQRSSKRDDTTDADAACEWISPEIPSEKPPSESR